MGKLKTPIQQKHWRIVGGVSLAVCAALVFTATYWPILRESMVWFSIYWLVFLVALFVTLYCVLLDLRYIRADYALERRDIFKDTLGDEEFRRALREAQRDYLREKGKNNNGAGE